MPHVTRISDNEFNVTLTDNELLILQLACIQHAAKPYLVIAAFFNAFISALQKFLHDVRKT